MPAGSELGLVCLAGGEPAPSLTWTREGRDLPDGSLSVAGEQLIFSSLEREHAGTYSCTGVTSQGKTSRDTVGVVVQCEYSPVELSNNYVALGEWGNVTLLLLLYYHN